MESTIRAAASIFNSGIRAIGSGITLYNNEQTLFWKSKETLKEFFYSDFHDQEDSMFVALSIYIPIFDVLNTGVTLDEDVMQLYEKASRYLIFVMGVNEQDEIDAHTSIVTEDDDAI